jgi:type I restriction enzyme S subunit
VTRYGLPKSAIGDAWIPLPSTDEQRAIADFLDRETAKLDTLVEKKRALIEKLKEKRAALISRTVTRGLPPDAARAAGLNPHPKLKHSGIEWLGDVPEHWSVSRLKHVIIKIEQGWSPDCDNALAAPDEWGVVKAGCCNGGYFNPDEHKALPADLDVPVNLEIISGDILMSRASGSEELVGSVARIPSGTRARLLLSDKTYRLLPNLLRVYPRLLVCLLQSFVGRIQIQKVINSASGLAKNIAQSDVKEFFLPLPPLLEQHALADYLDHETTQIDRLIEKVEAAIERLREYRTALITAAVTGKIDVRGAVPQRSAARAGARDHAPHIPNTV